MKIKQKRGGDQTIEESSKIISKIALPITSDPINHEIPDTKQQKQLD